MGLLSLVVCKLALRVGTLILWVWTTILFSEDGQGNALCIFCISLHFRWWPKVEFFPSWWDFGEGERKPWSGKLHFWGIFMPAPKVPEAFFLMQREGIYKEVALFFALFALFWGVKLHFIPPPAFLQNRWLDLGLVISGVRIGDTHWRWMRRNFAPFYIKKDL